MTLDEAAGIVALMGWELEIWNTSSGNWYYDVTAETAGKYIPEYIRNSKPALEPRAMEEFIAWVERGMATDNWRDECGINWPN